MLHLGCHLSLSKGYEAMGKEALKIGADTFQFFTRNPRGSRAKEIDRKDADALAAILEKNNFAPIVAHAPYTLNLCSSDPGIRKFARETIADDLARMEMLPCKLYNLHPGSHTGQGIETGIRQITDGLNEIIKPEQSTIILLETMGGKGSEVGSTFEELKTIIDGIRLKDKIGVCLDTCHVYDAGYDIVNDLDGVIARFNETIGLKHLFAIHLNDTMYPLGSHKDRHQKIGKGVLGLRTIQNVIHHPDLSHLPFNLETPNEVEGYAAEIELLRSTY